LASIETARRLLEGAAVLNHKLIIESSKQKNMKLKKSLLFAALVAGSLFTGSLTLQAQNAPAAPPAGGPGAGAGAGRGARGVATSDTLITRFQAALGETNKLSDAVVAKIKPVLDTMIKAQADLRADTAIDQAARATKRTAIVTTASDAIKAIVTPAQFAIIQPLLQAGGRGGGRGARGGAAPGN
jgi:hypothetical protein